MFFMLNEWDNLIHSVICLPLKTLKLQYYSAYKAGNQETQLPFLNWLHCLGQSFNFLLLLCGKKKAQDPEKSALNLDSFIYQLSALRKLT